MSMNMQQPCICPHNQPPPPVENLADRYQNRWNTPMQESRMTAVQVRGTQRAATLPGDCQQVTRGVKHALQVAPVSFRSGRDT
jgi:hypothetical protein